MAAMSLKGYSRSHFDYTKQVPDWIVINDVPAGHCTAMTNLETGIGKQTGRGMPDYWIVGSLTDEVWLFPL